MKEELIRIAIVIIGTIIGCGGLTLVFGIDRKHIFWALVSAVLCTVGYEVSMLLGCGEFLSAFIGSALAATYSDVMAHFLKVPATLMITIGILPLVPGASLYYTMLGVVNSDMDAFSRNGIKALWLAAGIAIGVIVVTAVSRPINAMIAERLGKTIVEQRSKVKKVRNSKKEG